MSLLNALGASAGALQAQQKALTVIQQNMVNASTPGYVKQRFTLEARPFDPAAGLPGGVAFALAGDIRSQYAESAVWRQVSAHSEAKEFVRALASLEPLLSSGDSSLAGSMRTFFSAASTWSANPNDKATREAFMVQARGLAEAFRGTGDQLKWMLGQIDSGIASTVSEINQITVQLRDAKTGAAEDATAYASLEDLASKAGITARKESDGTYTVALAGQATLLTGSSALELKVEDGSRVIGANGADLTDGITGGKLKGLLDARAEIVRLIGDGDSEGELNRLASAVATEVNSLLSRGVVSPGPPPVPGRDLFTWDKANPNAALTSMAISPDISASTLAPYDPGPPPKAAGIASEIALIGKKPLLDGKGAENFFTTVASQTATRMKTAEKAESTLAASLETAIQFRTDLSGVSIEEESVTLLATQRAYEASASVLKVIDEMLVTTLDLLR